MKHTQDSSKPVVSGRPGQADSFRLLFEQAPVGMCALNLDGSVAHANPELCKLLGYPREELVGLHLADVLHPRDVEEEVARRQELLSGATDRYVLEERYRHKSGNQVYVRQKVTLVRNRDGDAQFFVATLIDITKRVKAETALKESEARLQNSQRLAHLGWWQLDLTENRLYWSDETREIFGLGEESFPDTYESFMERVHPDDRERVHDAYQYSLDNKTPYSVVHRTLLPGGVVRWMQERGETLYDDAGRPRTSIGAVQDITDRVKTENALRATNQVVEATLDTTPVLIAYMDADMKFIRVNRAYAEVDEKTPDYFIGKNHFDLYPNAENEAIFRKVIETGEAHVAKARPFEYEHNPERGVTHWDWTLTPIKEKDGDVTALVLSLQDVTERIQMLEMLERQQQELTALNESLEQRVKERTGELLQRERQLETAQRIAHLGYWTVNLKSGELVWSDEIYRIFGQAPQSFHPSRERFYSTVHPDDRDEVLRIEKEAFEQNKIFRCDHRIVLQDGSVRWVHEEARTEKDGDGTPLSMTGTVQDITERKNIEHALGDARDIAERASQAKSEFLSRMSHELRTPMNAVLGFAQVLDLEDLSPEQKQCTEEIRQAGNHLLQLIDELLDMSRIEAGRFTVVIQSVDVCDVVRDACSMAQSVLAANEVTLNNNCEPGTSVLADPVRLRQVLVNLLTNAAKYNHKGGRVTVSATSLPDGSVKIAVTDTGPGISPADRNRLFQPFERLGAEHRNVEGTGIGLALSKKITTLMGGELELDSTPGHGSTFTVTLRSAGASHSHTARSLDREHDVADDGMTVLYIEDDAANLRVVEALLRRYPQYRLLSAVNGEYGLELARRYRPGLILLDIRLPGMDGYRVFEELQKYQETASIPVVALSADAMPIEIERGLKAGFKNYLTKPVRMDLLLAEFRDVLGESQS